MVTEMIDLAARNERLVRQGYAAFSRGDLEAVRGIFSETIVWHAQRLGQLGGDHDGWSSVLGFFARTMELTAGTFRVEIMDVLPGEELVAVVVRSTAQRGERTLDDRQVHLFRVDDGRAVEVWQYAGPTADDFWS